MRATSAGSALISRAAAARVRSYASEAKAGSSSHACPLRQTALLPASNVFSGNGLNDAALRKQTSAGISNDARCDGSIALPALKRQIVVLPRGHFDVLVTKHRQRPRDAPAR